MTGGANDAKKTGVNVAELHRRAVRRNQTSYKDPVTGFTCFTELAHLRRGVCCGSRCRHCPYNTEWSASLSNRVESGNKLDVAARLTEIQLEQEQHPPEQDIEDLDRFTTISSSIQNGSDSSSSSSSSFDEEEETSTSIPPCRPGVAPGDRNNSSNTTSNRNSNTQQQPPPDQAQRRTGGRHGGRTTAKNVPYTRGGDAGTTALGTGERRSKTDPAFVALGAVDELCSVTGLCRAHLLVVAGMAPNSDIGTGLPSSNYDGTRSSKNTAVVDMAMLNEWLLEIMSRLFDIGSHVARPPRRRKQTAPTSTANEDDDDDDSSLDTNDKHTQRDKESTPKTFVADGVGGGFHASHVTDLEDWIDLLTEELPELLSFILPTGSIAAAQLHVARTVCRRAERCLIPLVVPTNAERPTCDPNALRYLNRLSDFFFSAARFVNAQHGHDEILYRRPQRGATQRQRQVVQPAEGTKGDITRTTEN